MKWYWLGCASPLWIGSPVEIPLRQTGRSAVWGFVSLFERRSQHEEEKH